MKTSKRILLSIIFTLVGTMIGIVMHMILPSAGADVSDASYNSVFVNAVGFPAVASFYLVVQYAYIVFLVQYLGKNTNMKRYQVGLHIGLSVAVLYIIGMQEVVMESSPFTTYGIKFILYQFWMALGDAIPILVYSLVASFVFLEEKTISDCAGENKQPIKKTIIEILFVGLLIFVVRICGNLTGIIGSDIESYPVPTIIWTIVFGMTMGVVCVWNRHFFKGQSHPIAKNIILLIGLNWIWFNSMIILLMADTAGAMLLRSSVDIAVLCIGAVLFEKYLD